MQPGIAGYFLIHQGEVIHTTQVNNLFPCSDGSQIIYPGFRFGGGTGDLYMQAPDKCFVLQVLIYMWFKLHILILRSWTKV
jgi:hypothetical protein